MMPEPALFVSVTIMLRLLPLCTNWVETVPHENVYVSVLFDEFQVSPLLFSPQPYWPEETTLPLRSVDFICQMWKRSEE